MARRTRLKVCCIASVEEARIAVAAGADALGLVAAMPSGPGPIPDETIAEIAATVPPPVATFLLTCRTDPDGVVEHVRRCGTNTVQLVDAVAPETYAALRRHCPAVRIVQVLHVEDEAALEEARRVAPRVDALLLDSGRPSLAVKELGGTGRVHDWAVSARIVAESPVPVFLAGGLKAGNVADAVRAVRPFGIDLCSGVRTDGRLDPTRLEALVAALGAV
ncbi:phosphoribosylanthranilate isomerase [Rhodocista pekingensis]|uniref:N-(5'-phosphoribosyl)anthranilate isomerase n=1 Tax=Rhodocista pekingensis TaxID=201185 RepID=A0ABW2KRZ5_9PROT